MKVWCSRDKWGVRDIWVRSPTRSSGYWYQGASGGHLLGNTNRGIHQLFPKGVKKGQCVKCTLKRLEVDDGS